MCSLKAWHFSCQFDHEIICVNWRYLCMCLFCYGGGFVRTQMQRTKTESSEKRDRLAGRNADRQAGRQARLTGAGSEKVRRAGEQQAEQTGAGECVSTTGKNIKNTKYSVSRKH